MSRDDRHRTFDPGQEQAKQVNSYVRALKKLRRDVKVLSGMEGKIIVRWHPPISCEKIDALIHFGINEWDRPS
jgi:hypothetical protein